MARAREEIAQARREILVELIGQLQQKPRTSLAQLAAASALTEEFRRRAATPVRTPPPGHKMLPGLDGTP
jgi:hypothetical protein